MLQFKVLIVEDDEAAAQAAAAKLKACGLEVKIVHNGDKAIPMMKEWLPHVIVLDLHLPGKSGVEIAYEMRRDPLLRNIITISNSSHMESKGGLGGNYYFDYVHDLGEEPVMVDKTKPRDGIFNDLTAAVGILIGEKFQFIPRKMAEYLDNIKKEEKKPEELDSRESGNDEQTGNGDAPS